MYTYGHISLFPCPTCSPAFLTHIYLHELFHAWLHQADEQLYLDWQHCEHAEEFANVSFTLLGGSVAKTCGDYKAKLAIMHQRISLYDAFVGTLECLRGAAIKRWNPIREAEKLN